VAFPYFEIKSSSKPIAIIKTGDRQLEIVKISKIYSKYFTTATGGVFELDDQYEYKYNKTGIYFYNFSNSKPLSLTALNDIDLVLRKTGDSELINKQKLIEYFEAVEGKPPDLQGVQSGIMEKLETDTHKFIQDYSSDDEFAKTNILIDVHNQKKPIKSLSSPLMGIGMSKGHIAIIQTAHKQIDIVEMSTHDKRAYTKYGTFALTRDNIYWYKKQMVCIFTLNSSDSEPAKPLQKSHQSSIKKMIHNKQWYSLEVFNRSSKSTSLGQSAPTENVTLSSEKPLIQYTADSPSIYHSQIKEIWGAKDAVAQKLSDPFKKAVPIMVIFACLAGFALLVSNIPMIMDTVAKYMGYEPKYVVINEDMAKNLGIKFETVLQDEGDLGDLEPDDLIANVDPTMVIPDTEEVIESEFGEEITAPIVIADTTIPTIQVPDIVEKQADNGNGMRVEYTVTAFDNVDGDLSPICIPISGSIFPVGETMVVCTAIDMSGNTARETFPVIVTARANTSPAIVLPPIDAVIPPVP